MASSRAIHDQEVVFDRLRKQSRSGGAARVFKKMTAAELVAAYSDADQPSMIEVSEIKPGDLMEYAYVAESTVDGDFELTNTLGYAYLSGASTTDVYNNGEAIPVRTENLDEGTYKKYFTSTISDYNPAIVKVGAAAYIQVQGSELPTEGSITVCICVRR